MAFDAPGIFLSHNSLLEKEVVSYVSANEFKKKFKEYTYHQSADEGFLQAIENFLVSYKSYSTPVPAAPTCLVQCSYHNKLVTQISFLRNEYIITRSATLLLEIVQLIRDLYSRVSLYVSQKKSSIKRLKYRLKKLAIRDLRSFFRNIIRFLFKNMNDSSGSDSEALKVTHGYKKSFIFKNHFHDKPYKKNKGGHYSLIE